jgi:hypothetical protein
MASKSKSGVPPKPRPTKLEALLVSHGVENPHPRDVMAYLSSHRELAKIVPLVCEQARREFGEEAELILTVYRDLEIDDRHLTLNVRLKSYGDLMVERMDRVTQPFEEQLCKASGYLLVTTDFQPSRAKNGF